MRFEIQNSKFSLPRNSNPFRGRKMSSLKFEAKFSIYNAIWERGVNHVLQKFNFFC